MCPGAAILQYAVLDHSPNVVVAALVACNFVCIVTWLHGQECTVQGLPF